MSHRKETNMKTGREPGDVAVGLLQSVFREGVPIRESVIRLIPAGKAIYLLPIILFFFSLFFGRYVMDPVETLRILTVGTINAFLDGASSLLSTVSGHQVLLP